MEMLQVVWKQHLRPRAVVGYGVKIFLPSPPNYVTRSPGESRCHITIEEQMFLFTKGTQKRFNLFQFIQLLVLNFLVLCGHVIL